MLRCVVRAEILLCNPISNLAETEEGLCSLSCPYEKSYPVSEAHTTHVKPRRPHGTSQMEWYLALYRRALTSSVIFSLDITRLQTCCDLEAGLKHFTELNPEAFRSPCLYSINTRAQENSCLIHSLRVYTLTPSWLLVVILPSSEKPEIPMSPGGGGQRGARHSGQLWATDCSAETGEEGEPSPSLLMEDTRFKVSCPFASHGRSQTGGEHSYPEQSAEISFVPYLIQEKRGISSGASSPPVPLSTAKSRRSSKPL